MLDYLAETQKSSLEHIDRLLPYRPGTSLEIDQSSRRSLEITRTIREGRREGSLLAVLDRTVTAMGSRLLAEWVASPLTEIAAIERRHEAVDELIAEPPLADDLREALRRVYDVERLLGPRDHRPGHPRDLSFLGRTLAACRRSRPGWPRGAAARLIQCEAEIDLCPDLRASSMRPWSTIAPFPPATAASSATAFTRELDALRELARGGKQWIAQYQSQQIRADGHRQPQSRLQQGLRLLHRGHQRAPRARSRTTTSASRRSRTPSGTSRRS